MLEDIQDALISVSIRAGQTGAAIEEASVIAEDDPQQAIESVRDKLPMMSRLVQIRPMYDDWETAMRAGKDPHMDDVVSLLDNARDYVVDPVGGLGLSGDE